MKSRKLIITALAVSMIHLPTMAEDLPSNLVSELPSMQEEAQVEQLEKLPEVEPVKTEEQYQQDSPEIISETPEPQTENYSEEEITSVIESGIEENQYMSLERCLQIAIANNPTIKAAISNTEVYQHKIGQAKAGYFPKLNISNGYSTENATSLSATDPDTNSFNIINIGLNQLIYDFGKTTTDIDIKKTNFSAKEEDLKTEINQTVFNVKEAYFQLLLSFHRQEVMEESVEQYGQLLSQAKAFYEVGSKPKIDVMTAEVNLSNAQLSLIKAKNLVNIAFAGLNNTMGLPESPFYQLKDKLRFAEEDFAFNELIQKAYDNRPDFKSAMLQVQASEKNINLAKKDYLPSLGGFTGFSLRHLDDDVTSDTDSGWNAGVALKLPVLNGYLVKKKVNEATANYEKEVSEAQALKNNLYFQVKQTYMEFIEAKNSVPTAEVALKQSKESYDLAKGRYEVGVGNPIELKDAELTYRNAKLAHFNALYDYNVALAKLENVTGSKL